MNHFNKFSILCMVFLIGGRLFAHLGCSEMLRESAPCPKVVQHKHTLVDVKKVVPTTVLDLKYATDDNFAKKAVYPSDARCYLTDVAAQALKSASDEFNTLGFSVKIWDAYRPHRVQYTFWGLVPDERYVADPKKGSRHNRGCAVDITLVDKDGKELNMGTEFDNFTERAHRTCKDFSDEVLKNRQLLEDVMRKHGFTGLQTEWWHYDYNGWQAHPLLDVSFEELRETVK
jgi:D-alanyl-D-alanine dipeptidase